MIRPKRILHRIAWSILCVGLPILFVVSIGARKPVPMDKTLSLTFPGVWDPAPLADIQFTLLDGSVNAQISRAVSGAMTLHLDPAKPLSLPTVLVYQSTGAVDQGLLLGSFRGEGAQSYSLIPTGESQQSEIVLYDLSHQVELDRAPVPARGRVP